jgi:hypothetical protein
MNVKIDISPPPLHKVKSNTNLKKCFKEVCVLDKTIPKNLSHQTRSSLWSLPVKEVRRKSDYSDRSPSKFPKVSGKGQPISYPVSPILGKSRQLPLVPCQQVPTMANRYAPLVLPTNLNPMPVDYGTKNKKFGGEDDYIVRKHIQWFKDFCELNEIDHEDVQIRLFSQSLRADVKEWFRGLAAGSINTIEGFYVMFRDRWEEKKNYVQMLTIYNQLKRGNDESIKNFSLRFNTVYNSLPIDCKPPEGMAKLHYVEAFNDEFSLFLRERRSQTLA